MVPQQTDPDSSRLNSAFALICEGKAGPLRLVAVRVSANVNTAATADLEGDGQ